MSRRGSGSSFSSSSDVNFDDLDDHQVFGYLEDDDDSRPSTPGSRLRSPSADFRLDFSSRISASRAPPPSKPAITPNKPATRKSMVSTKPRSPSLTAKKRIVKRPASLTLNTLSSPTSKIFSQNREYPTEGMTLASSASSSKDFESDSFFEEATTATTTVTTTTTTIDTNNDRLDDTIDGERANSRKESPISTPPSPKARKGKSVGATRASESVAVAPLGSANALVGALASLQAQVELLTSEKTQLEAAAVKAQTTIQELEQKVAASEQSSDLFARQLANVKESFQAKLMAREEEVSLEKMTLAKEKETQLQHQQARFTTEAELWKHEIAALTKVKLDLENENDRLCKELNDEDLQRGFAEAEHRTLNEEHTRTCEELQMLIQEREQFEHAQVKIQELRSRLTENIEQHELQRQYLENQVKKLQVEKEDQLAGWERERQNCLRQNEKDKSKLLRFAQEVRGLHHLLQLSVAEAREQLNTEVKKTKSALEGIQQQASEFAVHQSDREVALMSRKGRILQLETQLKNDRQTINQLEATLAKSTRSLEKKYVTLKQRFQEQKEHLEITLAVRQGLTTDLQTKRTQVAELEREVTRLSLTKSKTEVKLKHSQQQIVAMQKVHAREVEKMKKKSPGVTNDNKLVEAPPTNPSQVENNESNSLLNGNLEEPEWREFVELVAAYEAERQLHIGAAV